MQDPNHTLFGLADGGQDPQATLYYKDSIVLPEITVTPKGNYIHNTYDNLKIYKKGGLFQNTKKEKVKIRRSNSIYFK